MPNDAADKRSVLMNVDLAILLPGLINAKTSVLIQFYEQRREGEKKVVQRDYRSGHVGVKRGLIPPEQQSRTRSG